MVPAGGIAAGAVVLVGVGLWLRARRRGRDAGEIVPDAAPETPAVVEAVTEAGEPFGVRGAWRRVEDMVAPEFGALAVSRTSSSTSRLVMKAGVEPELVSRLAGLYDRSRYSAHPLEPADEAEAERLADIITAMGRSR